MSRLVIIGVALQLFTVYFYHKLNPESFSLGPEACQCVNCTEDKLCGSLWKGLSYPGQVEIGYLNEKRVHIVVSHYTSDLQWICCFTVTGGYFNVASMHVISKCGWIVTGAPVMAVLFRGVLTSESNWLTK